MKKSNNVNITCGRSGYAFIAIFVTVSLLYGINTTCLAKGSKTSSNDGSYFSISTKSKKTAQKTSKTNSINIPYSSVIGQEAVDDNQASPQIIDEKSEDLDKVIGVGVETFKDTFYDSDSLAITDFSSEDTETFSRDFIIDTDRRDFVAPRLALLEKTKKKGIIPFGRIHESYTDNLFSTRHDKKDEYVSQFRYSLIAFYNTANTSLLAHYDGDFFYYANYPRFNRFGNEFKLSCKLFKSKRFRLSLNNNFSPTSVPPGGTDQLAKVYWVTKNTFVSTMIYDLSPKTSLEFRYIQPYLNHNVNEPERRSFSNITHTLTPAIRYKVTPLTTFIPRYTFKSGDFFNEPSLNYSEHTGSMTMQTKITYNTYIEATLGYTARLFNKDMHKDFYGLTGGLTYKLSPDDRTRFQLEIKKGLQDANSLTHAYRPFMKVFASFRRKIFIRNLELLLKSGYTRNNSVIEISGKESFISNSMQFGSMLEYNIKEIFFFNVGYNCSIESDNLSGLGNKESNIYVTGRIAY